MPMSVQDAWSSSQRRAIGALIATGMRDESAGPRQGTASDGASDRASDRASEGIGLLANLIRVVPADEVAAVTVDVHERRVIAAAGYPIAIGPPRRTGGDSPFWEDCWVGLPCPIPAPRVAERSGTGRPARLPEPSFTTHLRRVRLQGLLGVDPTDVVTMFLPLSISRELAVQVMFVRRTGTFSESERLMVTLLAPHLRLRLRRTALSGAGLGAPTDGSSDARSGFLPEEPPVESPQVPPLLTGRQRTVLLLAAHGYSSNEIAQHLQLSPGTVHKHFDNIFDRLRVSNRLAAVMRVFPHGVPPEHAAVRETAARDLPVVPPISHATTDAP